MLYVRFPLSLRNVEDLLHKRSVDVSYEFVRYWWHDVPNGNGWIVVEASDQEALTSWIMGWSGQCTFPTVTPVVDDATARKLVNAMLAAQH